MGKSRIAFLIGGALVLAMSAYAQDAPTHAPTNLSGAATSGPAALIPSKPNTYGPFTSYHRVGFSEFSPANTLTTYSDLSQSTSNFSRFPTANAGSAFNAVPHLNSGALVSEVEFDWCDTNAVTNTTMNVYSSSFTGAGATFLGTASSSGSGGCGFSVATLTPAFEVDNNFNQLVLIVFVPDTDGSTAVSGAIMRYVLQVSPAPATASFGDVGTGHPQFRWIEALYAAGITAGCAGGNYCPDAPLTRGQMAVFLSLALGLHFP